MPGSTNTSEPGKVDDAPRRYPRGPTQTGDFAMSDQVYRYALCRPVPFPEILATLDLALIAVESLHGQERARLDARYSSDAGKKVVVIDATTPVGQALNQIFTGFARREFGEHAFRIDRIDQAVSTSAAVGTAA